MLSEFVGKNQVAWIVPQGTSRQLKRGLLRLLGAEECDDAGGDGHLSCLAVFCLVKIDIPFFAPNLLELPTDGDNPGVKIDVIPLQPQQLGLAQPGEKVNHIESAIFVRLASGSEASYIIIHERAQLRFLRLG